MLPPLQLATSVDDVSTHVKIDYDAKEIEELLDLTTTLFVYENGGGGLCRAADIATTAVHLSRPQRCIGH